MSEAIFDQAGSQVGSLDGLVNYTFGKQLNIEQSLGVGFLLGMREVVPQFQKQIMK